MDSSPFLRASGTADASVRPAFPDDAAEIARVQAVTWRTAYRSVLPPSVLDDWDADAATAAWQRAVSTPPTPGHGVLVALEKNTLVGFAAYGPAELSAEESTWIPTPHVTTRSPITCHYCSEPVAADEALLIRDGETCHPACEEAWRNLVAGPRGDLPGT